MDLNSITKRLQNEFVQKKLQAEFKATQNKLRLEKIPQYQKLSSLERQIMFEVAKNKMAKKPVKDLESSLAEIEKQKQVIMKKLGITKKDLITKYDCKICKDLGFVGEQMCSCFKKRRNEELLAECGFTPSGLASFDKFDTSSIKDKSQAEKLEKIKTKLIKWADDYPNVKRTKIIFHGTTGVGKTFMSECLAKLLLEKGFSVCFLTAFELGDLMLKYHTTFGAGKHEVLTPVLESDFLFIDDLGTEPLLKNVTLNYFYLIISEREKFKKPIIISTNLTSEALMDRYEERIYSRLTNKNTCGMFHIEGNDLRR